MSWLGDLGDLSAAIDDEFSTPVRFIGVVSKPNQRAAPDPTRPAFCGRGVYHEPSSMLDRGNKDGLKESSLTTSEPSLSIRPADLPWKLQQGDMIELPEIGRSFRVIDFAREMHTRTRLVLEALERIAAA